MGVHLGLSSTGPICRRSVTRENSRIKRRRATDTHCWFVSGRGRSPFCPLAPRRSLRSSTTVVAELPPFPRVRCIVHAAGTGPGCAGSCRGRVGPRPDNPRQDQPIRPEQPRRAGHSGRAARAGRHHPMTAASNGQVGGNWGRPGVLLPTAEPTPAADRSLRRRPEVSAPTPRRRRGRPGT
jgi:hypothetical protein